VAAPAPGSSTHRCSRRRGVDGRGSSRACACGWALPRRAERSAAVGSLGCGSPAGCGPQSAHRRSLPTKGTERRCRSDRRRCPIRCSCGRQRLASSRIMVVYCCCYCVGVFVCVCYVVLFVYCCCLLLLLLCWCLCLCLFIVVVVSFVRLCCRLLVVFVLVAMLCCCLFVFVVFLLCYCLVFVVVVALLLCVCFCCVVVSLWSFGVLLVSFVVVLLCC